MYPIDVIKSALKTHTPNQVKISKIANGGRSNTCGVPTINYEVHFITATPIFIFYKLQHIQISSRTESPQTAYEPYIKYG
jgi:hypothetical protein